MKQETPGFGKPLGFFVFVVPLSRKLLPWCNDCTTLLDKGMVMPQIQLTASLSIWFYPKDHAPPHFHVIGPDTAVLVDLRDFQVMEGSYKRKDLRAALAYATDHLDELWQAWREQHDEL